jgi:hypothetical protein
MKTEETGRFYVLADITSRNKATSCHNLSLFLPLLLAMDNLTPEQAQALWDAGGFLILSDLPEGSEFGISRN